MEKKFEFLASNLRDPLIKIGQFELPALLLIRDFRARMGDLCINPDIDYLVVCFMGPMRLLFEFALKRIVEPVTVPVLQLSVWVLAKNQIADASRAIVIPEGATF